MATAMRELVLTANMIIAASATAHLMSTIRCPWLSAQAFKPASPSFHHNHWFPTSLRSPPLVPSARKPISATIISLSNEMSHFKTRGTRNVALSATTQREPSSSTRNAAATETEKERIRQQQQTNNSASKIINSRQNNNEMIFRKRLDELVEFRFQNGHGSIPTPYPPNPTLGIWAANLRRQYAIWKAVEQQGGRYLGYLTPQRRQKLMSAGFDFTSLTERQFRTRLRELEVFKETYGHCMVPEKWEENAALGAWVSNLRSLYKRRSRKTLSQKRQTIQLQQHGEEETNDNSVQKRRGSKNILLQPVYPVKKQQRAPRFSNLDEERIKLLEDMGFVWNSNDRKWLEMLEWAKVYGVVNSMLRGGLGDIAHDRQEVAFVEEHGGNNHNNYTNLLLDNYHNLVRNIQNQSLLPSFHRQDTILALLWEETNALGQPQAPTGEQAMNITSSNNQCPSSKFMEVKALFQPSSLDYRIPPNDTQHGPLRIWMVNQRSNYNRLHQSKGNLGEVDNNQSSTPYPSSITSTMTSQRQNALEEIHFPWSGRFRNRIEQVQFIKEEMAERERRKEKERRREQKEREERERVEKILSSRICPGASGGGEGGGGVIEAVVDVMALWEAEDDDDDDDDDDNW